MPVTKIQLLEGQCSEARLDKVPIHTIMLPLLRCW